MTEADWWALCDLDPAAFPWSHFADWLEERRDPRADAARQVGRAGWVPHYHIAPRQSWSWLWRDGTAGPSGLDALPPHVFARLVGVGWYENWRQYPSPSAACRALLDALHKQGFSQKG
jgi:hypothetical protein